MNRFLPSLSYAILLLSCITATGQEDILTILERGYPAQWLVCGPFESDLEQGIVDAVANAQIPLGRNDFMASRGGINSIRPAHGLEVDQADSVAIWLQTRAEASTVDMAPFFTEVDSGVAFAAFYATSRSEQTVLIDLQSALGARVFLNGAEIREANAAPLSLNGVDLFAATFQPGNNLFMLEIPGAKLDALAARMEVPLESIRENHFQNRADLVVRTGFEFRLAVKPLEPLGDLLYVPVFESTGTFSGQGSGLFQDVWFTVFNPTDTPSSSLEFTATATGAASRINASIASIPPNSSRRTRLRIPIGGTTPGQPVRVNSMLSLGRDSAKWPSSVIVAPAPANADLYAVMLPSPLNPAVVSQSDVAEQHYAELNTNILRNAENPEFGFSLGSAEQWLPILSVYPEFRSTLGGAIKNRSVAPWSSYGLIDERVASGEAIIRNLWIGNTLAQQGFDATPRTYWAWGSPAIAPQTPQILADAGISGVVHNLPYDGLPSMYYQLAPDGSRILHRRKSNTPALKSVLNLHQTAQHQHRFWQEAGFESDLLIRENTAHAPETFWATDTLPLSDATPPIHVVGAGADQYFDALDRERPFQMAPHFWNSRNATNHSPWDLLRYPELNDHYARNQQQLHAAETFATFNAFNGATYPFAGFNDAWKKTLYLSHPQRTSERLAANIYLDHLDVHRGLSDLTGPILSTALDGIAKRAATDLPGIANTPGVQAILVFNPTGQPRTDILEMTLTLDNAEGLTILDSEGNSVPFEASNLFIRDRRLTILDVRFLAKSVPSVGYTTYFAVPTGVLAQSTKVFTPYIENDFFQVAFENGQIAGIVDRSGRLAEMKDLTFNDVVAYHLLPDEESVQWNNDITRSSALASETTFESTPLGQRAVIKTPFAGGTVQRTVTLYNSVPWIDVTVDVTGADLSDKALGIEFEPFSGNLSPITGHQFGHTFAARINPSTQLREPEDDTASPFLGNTSIGFHGLAQAPAIVVADTELVIPIEPTMIVHTGQNSHDRAAKELQEALVRRGVQSSSYGHQALDTLPTWRDDTLPRQFNDDLGFGTRFRILIGNAEDNALTAALLDQLPDGPREIVLEHIEQSLPVFALDGNVPFGFEPVPTLLIAGRNVNATRDAVLEVARQIAEEGNVSLTPDRFLLTSASPKSAWGLSVLHASPAVSRVETDTLTHFVFTDDGAYPNDDISAPGTRAFRYGLYPYSGVVPTNQIGHIAQRYATPLIGHQTSIHPGTQPSVLSFLDTASDHFLVTSIHPKVPHGSLISDEDSTLEAVIVRGYETLGRAGDVDLNFLPTTYGVAKLNPLDVEQGPVRTLSGDITFDVKPNGIGSFALYTAPSGRRSADPDAATRAPVASRSWTQNAGPASGTEQSITVRVNEPLPMPSGPVQITIANNSPDNRASGQLTAVVAQGWTVSPSTQRYSIAPNGFGVFKVTVSRDNPELMHLGVLAQADFEGTTYFDVATIGDYPVEIESAQQKNEYMITIRNKGGLPIIGTAELFTSFDTVPGDTSFTPRNPDIHLQPYQEKRVVFTNTRLEAPGWMVAKVSVNNKTYYHHFEVGEQ